MKNGKKDSVTSRKVKSIKSHEQCLPSKQSIEEDEPLQALKSSQVQIDHSNGQAPVHVVELGSTRAGGFDPLLRSSLPRSNPYDNQDTAIRFPAVRTILWDQTQLGAAATIRPVDLLPQLFLPITVARSMFSFLLDSPQVQPAEPCCLAIARRRQTPSDGMGSAFDRVLVFDRVDGGRKDPTFGTRLAPSATADGDVPCPVFLREADIRFSASLLHFDPQQYLGFFEEYHANAQRHGPIDVDAYSGLRFLASVSPEPQILHLAAEMVLPALQLRLSPISPLRIVPSPLSSHLMDQTARDKLQTGYLTMDQSRRALPLLSSDAKAFEVPLVGIWITGLDSPEDPYVWCACVRYLMSEHIKERAFVGSSFLVMFYSPSDPHPYFFDSSHHIGVTSFTHFRCAADVALRNLPSSPGGAAVPLRLEPVTDPVSVAHFSMAFTQQEQPQQPQPQAHNQQSDSYVPARSAEPEQGCPANKPTVGDDAPQPRQYPPIAHSELPKPLSTASSQSHGPSSPPSSLGGSTGREALPSTQVPTRTAAENMSTSDFIRSMMQKIGTDLPLPFSPDSSTSSRSSTSTSSPSVSSNLPAPPSVQQPPPPPLPPLRTVIHSTDSQTDQSPQGRGPQRTHAPISIAQPAQLPLEMRECAIQPSRAAAEAAQPRLVTVDESFLLSQQDLIRTLLSKVDMLCDEVSLLRTQQAEMARVVFSLQQAPLPQPQPQAVPQQKMSETVMVERPFVVTQPVPTRPLQSSNQHAEAAPPSRPRSPPVQRELQLQYTAESSQQLRSSARGTATVPPPPKERLTGIPLATRVPSLPQPQPQAAVPLSVAMSPREDSSDEFSLNDLSLDSRRYLEAHGLLMPQQPAGSAPPPTSSMTFLSMPRLPSGPGLDVTLSVDDSSDDGLSSVSSPGVPSTAMRDVVGRGSSRRTLNFPPDSDSDF